LNVAQQDHCHDEDSDGEREEGGVVSSFCFGAAHFGPWLFYSRSLNHVKVPVSTPCKGLFFVANLYEIFMPLPLLFMTLLYPRTTIEFEIRS
jgi:hypothetical protein